MHWAIYNARRDMTKFQLLNISHKHMGVTRPRLVQISCRWVAYCTHNTSEVLGTNSCIYDCFTKIQIWHTDTFKNNYNCNNDDDNYDCSNKKKKKKKNLCSASSHVFSFTYITTFTRTHIGSICRFNFRMNVSYMRKESESNISRKWGHI